MEAPLMKKLTLFLAVAAVVLLYGSSNAVAMRHHHARTVFVLQSGPFFVERPFFAERFVFVQRPFFAERFVFVQRPVFTSTFFTTSPFVVSRGTNLFVARPGVVVVR